MVKWNLVSREGQLEWQFGTPKSSSPSKPTREAVKSLKLALSSSAPPSLRSSSVISIVIRRMPSHYWAGGADLLIHYWVGQKGRAELLSHGWEGELSCWLTAREDSRANWDVKLFGKERQGALWKGMAGWVKSMQKGEGEGKMSVWVTAGGRGLCCIKVGRVESRVSWATKFLQKNK